MKSLSSIKSEKKCVLTLNGGSSSIKFAIYKTEPLVKVFYGKVDRIGLPGTNLTFSDSTGNNKDNIITLDESDFRSASNFLLNWLGKEFDFSVVSGVGHRVVFGMQHTIPVLISPKILDDLNRFTSYDPDHLPAEIRLIETVRQRFPNLPQVACFDTAFHSKMPGVAKMLAIPRRFTTKGIQRYGFHGLSYAFLMEELSRVAGEKAAFGRVILAHLGNGASMAAVHKGKSVDTSMGFTPAAGLVMGTRTGDLDPGVAWYIMQSEDLSIKQFNYLINHESGLLGISEISSDMRDLLEAESSDIRAAEAVELFCYQARKWIGAFAAALGGLDTLVFAGGVGENSPVIRSRICMGLKFLGIELEGERNKKNDSLIGKENAKVAVRIIHTDEERMIVKNVIQTLNISVEKNKNH